MPNHAPFRTETLVGDATVPGFSASWYHAIAGWAVDAPGWIRPVAMIGTQALLVLFVVLLLVAAWRARDDGYWAVATPLVAVSAGAVAWGLSGLSKTWWRQPRPCRAEWTSAEFTGSLARCADYGQWSLPSSHAAIAGAFAVGLTLVWRRLMVLAGALAVLQAFVRVYIGVHYPHDVLLGLLLGAFVAASCVGPLVRRARRTSAASPSPRRG